jgi:hypothetical protein
MEMLVFTSPDALDCKSVFRFPWSIVNTTIR